VDIEFALHGGLASRWAQDAQPGDTIGATVLGSKFSIPEPPPAGYVIVGDTASLPAINSLLEAIVDAPAQVFLEAGYDEDKDLPVARDADVTWVDRKNDGEALVEMVKSSAFDASGHFGWVACDSRTTRSVTKVMQNDFGIPRKSIAARAYWMVGRSME
jgi:NADPH-dependent ferric siderophore reductase